MNEYDKLLAERIEIALFEGGFNATQAEFLARVASNPLLKAVQREQDRQVAKWGVQNHPSFTPGDPEKYEALYRVTEDIKARNDLAAKNGGLAWESILLEEVFEAGCEWQDNEALKVELIQVAAVALSWVESIDRAAQPQATIEDAQSESEAE